MYVSIFPRFGVSIGQKLEIQTNGTIAPSSVQATSINIKRGVQISEQDFLVRKKPVTFYRSFTGQVFSKQKRKWELKFTQTDLETKGLRKGCLAGVYF